MTEYDFRALSPIDFEDFIRDLLNSQLHASFVTFAVGPDGGIDLRDQAGGNLRIAQCKHHPDATRAKLLRIAAAQKKDLEETPVDQYFLVTSAAISPQSEVELERALEPLPVATGGIWHKGRLNTILEQNSAVLRKHFKLWLASGDILQRILRTSEWEKSEALLARVSDRVRLYVNTAAFLDAWQILEDTNAVVISGAPGVGKSTLAEMILLNYWHDGWRVVNITDNLDAAWPEISTTAEKLILYCDDFLGQTDIAEVSGKAPGTISLLLDRIKAGNGSKRLILTTRDQVIAQAKSGRDDRLRRLDVDDIRARIRLAQLTRAQKARILFNHLHFAVSNRTHREQLALDRRYFPIVDHPNFNPRIIESATLRQKFSSVDDFYERIDLALRAPEEIWAGSFEQLSPMATSILFQLATSTGSSLNEPYLRRNLLGRTDPRKWTAALRVLEGSWITVTTTASGVTLSLFDASRRDFLHSLLNQRHYFDHMLSRALTVSQLEYIVDLLGRRSPAALERPGTTLAGARAHLAESIAILLARTSTLLDRDLADAIRDEEAGGGSVRSSERDSHAIFHHLLSRSARIQHIKSATRVSAFAYIMGGNSSPLTSAIVGYASQLIEDMDDERDNRAHATPLMSLAAALFELETDRSREISSDLVRIAAGRLFGTDDLDHVSTLPVELLTPELLDDIRPDIEFALESEKDGISQQNDPNVVEQWLGEVERHASVYGIGLYLDDLYEHLNELRKLPLPKRRSPSLEPARKAESDDEHIRTLFERLRIEE